MLIRCYFTHISQTGHYPPPENGNLFWGFRPLDLLFYLLAEECC